MERRLVVIFKPGRPTEQVPIELWLKVESDPIPSGQMGLQMELHHFLKAVADNMKSPVTIMTRDGLSTEFMKAAEIVLAKMKQESKVIAFE